MDIWILRMGICRFILHADAVDEKALNFCLIVKGELELFLNVLAN
jgi:hypothetical protein